MVPIINIGKLERIIEFESCMVISEQVRIRRHSKLICTYAESQ